jgi:hypothetical protein
MAAAAADSGQGSQRRIRLHGALTNDTRNNDDAENERRRKKRSSIVTIPAGAGFVKQRGTAPRFHNKPHAPVAHHHRGKRTRTPLLTAQWPRGRKRPLLRAEPGRVIQVEPPRSAASLNNNLTRETWSHHHLSLSPGEARRGRSLLLVSHLAGFLDKNADCGGGTSAGNLSTRLRN